MIVKPFAPAQSQYCKTANSLWDFIMPTCTPAEFMILGFIFRRTIGFNKPEVRLSYDKITSGTGIKGRATISKALDGLDAKNYITRRGERRGAIWYGVNQGLEIEVKSSSKNEPDDSQTSSEIELVEDSPETKLVQKLNYASSEIELDETKLVQKLNTYKDIYLKDNIERQHDVAAADEVFNSPELLPDKCPELTAVMDQYRNNVGPLTQRLAQDIEDTFNHLSPPPGETKADWFDYAILAALSNRKNRWSYILGIIKGIINSGSLQAHKEQWNGQDSTTRGGKGVGESQSQQDSDYRSSAGETYAESYGRVNDDNISEHIRKLTN